MLWLKRLHEIQEEAKEAGEKRLEEYVSDSIELMAEEVKEQKGLQNWGNHQDKHLLCLKKLVENENPKENDNDN